MAGRPDEFAEAFSAKLEALNETQQSINQLSCWLRFQHKRSLQAAQMWAAAAVKAPASRQLLFVYLLNDVLQTSRRRLPELCDHFGAKMEEVLPTLYKMATPQSSDVLDRTLASTQTDSNLAQVLRDEPVDDPSQLGVALGRADAAHALLVENNAALAAELEDRKRLILLLCTAVEQQDTICAELVSAIEQGNATLARVVDTRTRLDSMQNELDKIAGMAAD